MTHTLSRFSFILLIFFTLLPALSRAGSYTEISAPVVKNMLEKDNALVINLLSHLEHDLHHITGSINIPLDELATSAKLPKDLNTPLIFYCMGFR